MSKFRKHSKENQPSISTAALPDIVFMLLFFFMVGAELTTENFQQFIELERPKAQDLSILKNDRVSYFYVGRPKADAVLPTRLAKDKHILLANDKPISIDEIGTYINEAREDAGAYSNDLIAQLTIDGETTAEFETQLKMELSKARQYDISLTGNEVSIDKMK